MDLTLSEEHEALRASVEDFARKEVAPVIGELYERGEFPYEIVAKMGAMGLFGLAIAEEYGGMGGDYFALCLALEELARVDSSVAITLEAGVSLGEVVGQVSSPDLGAIDTLGGTCRQTLRPSARTPKPNGECLPRPPHM